ncbi:MAG: ABC transporter permease [Oscillospiraceae bacterium]|nr:ABC transporter permease [Oscillospiraceae bacterium]
MTFYNLKKALKPYSMAIVSVFISVLSINIVSIISMAGKAEIARELDGVGMNGMTVCAYNSYNENITDINLYNILYNCNDISRLTPVLYDLSYVQFNTGTEKECMCWGISPMAEDIVNLVRIHGRMLNQTDMDTNNFVCLVDENVALAAYGRSNITGKDIFLSVGSGIYKFEVIGVVNKTSNVLNGMSGEIIPDFIYIPFTVMENLSHRKGLDQIIINVSDENINEQSIEKYIRTNATLNSGTRLEINNLSRQRETINNIVDIAFMALFAVSCVAVIVCSISVATSVNTAVSQAKHDIGIKISLGASKTDIMLEFLFYSLIACVTGILSGTFAGTLALAAVNIINKSAYTFDYRLLSRGLSATIFLAVIFSIYPSYQAASLTPVKALNRE